ncbi:alpha/beta hydrolase [Phaeodactylibacter sp.]|uniref:alpha/beta hydrolase n=1 Tax=Phaeodactylibacter sp. TaxID=1940289 RepID=UPI0025FC1950|nr:alpha/beta hydrolase [Phaeodactylibacter sp.]MCI4647239.1 alpha/beta hydrolase [Phaeodactylibacter sp.]MCI5089593.1 alpha/beta hydrolase [Phaeodactylibacter sp.]
MKTVILFLMASLLIVAQTISQTKPDGEMKKSIESKSIVFIHGLFLNSGSWAEWKSFFEEKGYTTYAPSYLGHEGDPAKLREKAPESLGQLTFSEVVDQMEAFIKTLPEKPILVGHSMGALVAQKLVEKELAEAAVIISSAPPQGVITTKLSFAKSNLGLLNPFKGNSVHYPTKKWFHYAFTNTLSREESDRIFEQYVVPESRNIPRETLKKAGKIDFKKPHVPMLFLSAEKDHIIPASLNSKNFKRYKDSNSIREHKIFEGKDHHFIVGSEHWKEVATYVHSWIN